MIMRTAGLVASLALALAGTLGPAAAGELRPTVLAVHIQPDEGVSLEFAAKVPGQGLTLRTVHMDFLYGGAFRVDCRVAPDQLGVDGAGQP